MGINALEDSGVWTGMEDAMAVEIRRREGGFGGRICHRGVAPMLSRLKHVVEVKGVRRKPTVDSSAIIPHGDKRGHGWLSQDPCILIRSTPYIVACYIVFAFHVFH